MQLRDRILSKAVSGKGCTDQWVALQTLDLYREWIRQGLPHEDALQAAKSEMQSITSEALAIRRKRRRSDLAAWCVVLMGILACVGWWQLWE